MLDVRKRAGARIEARAPAEGPGADTQTRTGDLRFTKPLLYRLSYVGEAARCLASRAAGRKGSAAASCRRSRVRRRTPSFEGWHRRSVSRRRRLRPEGYARAGAPGARASAPSSRRRGSGSARGTTTPAGCSAFRRPGLRGGAQRSRARRSRSPSRPSSMTRSGFSAPSWSRRSGSRALSGTSRLSRARERARARKIGRGRGRGLVHGISATGRRSQNDGPTVTYTSASGRSTPAARSAARPPRRAPSARATPMRTSVLR